MAALLALSACAAQTPRDGTLAASQPERVARGRLLAQTQCAGCHAIGRADESAFPEAPPFRTLSRKYPIRDLEEAFAEGAIVGHPAMPAFRFEPGEIEDLLSYLESIQDAPSSSS